MKNYYQVLNLDPTCSMEEIKSAYKKYALEFHPDKHNGSTFFEARFLEVKEAYEILSNYQERRTHDNYHSFTQTNKSSETQPPPQNNHTRNYSQQNENQFSQQQGNSQRPGFNNYIDWAQKKYESGDFYGALEELEKAQRLEPSNGLINFIKANLYENSNNLLVAFKLYKKSFDMNYLKAKDDIIRLEALKNHAKRINIPYLFYSQSGVALSFVLYNILSNGMRGIQAGLIAEFAGVITGIIIVRLVFKKISRPVLNLLNTDWEIQLMILPWVAVLMGGFPFIMYLLNTR